MAPSLIVMMREAVVVSALWMLIPVHTLHSGRTVEGEYFDKINRPADLANRALVHWNPDLIYLENFNAVVSPCRY